MTRANRRHTMNSTLTLNAHSTKTHTSNAAGLARFLARKWDLLAVLSLMASSGIYGVYALGQMTGF